MTGVQTCALPISLKKYKIDVRMAFRTAYTLENVSNRAEPLSSVPPSMSLVLRLDEFMNRRYFFRTNEMSGGVEYLDRSMIQFVYKPYTTKVRNSICLEAQQEWLNVWDKDIDRYVNSDRVPIYHPIDHFLGNLPAWDGKERIRARSEERRVGKECLRLCRSRWSPYH